MKFGWIFSDFLEKTLQLLKISRFQFNFMMIIPEIHIIVDLIFDSNFDLIFNLIFTYVPRPRLRESRLPIRRGREPLAALREGRLRGGGGLVGGA